MLGVISTVRRRSSVRRKPARTNRQRCSFMLLWRVSGRRTEMSTRVSKLALGFAAAVLTFLAAFGPTSGRAQDTPGAPPPPPATNNPDQWAPPPPGLNAPPNYGGPVYCCTGAGGPATPTPDCPPCPPGVSGGLTKGLPPAAQGLKRLQQIQKEMPPGLHPAEPPHKMPPAPRLDPRIEAWINSPAYKAWAATHSHSLPPIYHCGHGKVSSTPCKYQP